MVKLARPISAARITAMADKVSIRRVHLPILDLFHNRLNQRLKTNFHLLALDHLQHAAILVDLLGLAQTSPPLHQIWTVDEDQATHLLATAKKFKWYLET